MMFYGNQQRLLYQTDTNGIISKIPLLDHFFVGIKIMQGNTVIAERTFTRHYMSSQISHQDIYGKHFQGRLFYDKKAIKTPSIDYCERW